MLTSSLHPGDEPAAAHIATHNNTPAALEPAGAAPNHTAQGTRRSDSFQNFRV